MPVAPSLRPITDEDLPFLRALYAGTRETELAAVAWSEAQKRAFLDSQFALQHAYYQQHYPAARFDLLLEDSTPIGRLYVNRTPAEMRVIDISLIAERRGRGIGTRLLRGLCEEAAQTPACVSIHVEKFNPAQALYRRLGFSLREERGAYDFLVWEPTAAALP
ncbi:MAG TPA: GNAT family N-acetyltransferase [Solimonas sp.]|nr:GNAT family N-acetyltransferase [Solimonas sp.]